MTQESGEVKLAVMQNDLTYIKGQIKEVNDKVSSNYVSKDEFEPIKKVVYGLVAIILVAVAGAVVSLVLR